MEQRKISTFTWLYPLAALLAIASLAVGIYLVLHARDSGSRMTLATGCALLASGVVSLIGVLAAWPITLSIDAARRPTLEHQEQLLTNLTERMEQISVMLNLISEQQLLSDKAKSVAFREKDRDALLRAIHEEMSRQDWESAMALVNDMETTFGNKSEADKLRSEVRGHRNEVVHKQINDRLEVIERHMKAEAWGTALQEAQHLMPMFPNEPQVQNLPQEIENRRQGRKKALLDDWKQAIDRHDVDGSIEILKRLDLYLTPQEAESMQETARGVFKEKLNNLKTQFSLAVQDHKWSDAIRLGEEIIGDFPNSRMAQEVREKMDSLRKRAAEPEESVKA